MDKNKITVQPIMVKVQNNSNSITEYQNAFDAIAKDDVAGFSSILNSTSFSIDSPFDYEDEDDAGKSVAAAKLYMPFHMAIAYSSPRVADLLLKKNVSILSSDVNSRNVLHNCVAAGFYCDEIEERAGKMINWLEGKIGEEAMWSLLTTENADGLRPLEYAAQQGTLNIMKTILNLKGYVIGQRVKGLDLFRLHDVTEYEVGNRHDKSPVNMLSYLNSDRLERKRCVKALLDPLLVTWIDGKMKSNIAPLILWIVLRFLMLSLVFIIDNDSSYWYSTFGNATESYFCADLLYFHPGLEFVYFTTSIMVILNILTLSCDVFTFIKWRFVQKQHYKKKDLKGAKSLLASTRFYQICQTLFLLIVMCLFSYYIHVIRTNANVPNTIFAILGFARAIIPIFMMWSTCYFAQLIPLIGSKIISLQRMLSDLASFLVVLGLTTLFFVHAFQLYAFSNSLTGCIDDFSNPWKSFYTLFLMLLNMYEVDGPSFNNAWLFDILHILYILLVGIMAVNFLIAIMSNSASVVAENEDVIVKVNQLAIVVTLEERIFWFMRRLYRQFRRYGFYWKGDRCCIVSVVDRNEELFHGKVVDLDTPLGGKKLEMNNYL